MTSPWVAIQSSMTSYCEKYFNAVNIWRSYSSEKLLENRVLIVATLCKLLHEDILNENEIEYKLDTETKINDSDFLPEYDSKATNDVEAFHEAKQIFSYDQKLFKSVGFYFQENLLKAMAGWSPEMLQKSNHKTRENLINLALLLFRLPESAGLATITRICNSNEISTVPLVENTIEEDESQQTSHYVLYRFLLKTRDSIYIPQSEPLKEASEEIAENIQHNEETEPTIKPTKEAKTKNEKRPRELETEIDNNSLDQKSVTKDELPVTKDESLVQKDETPVKKNASPTKQPSMEKLNWDKPASLVGLKVTN